MLVWRLVILLKCLPEKKSFAYKEGKRRLKTIWKKQEKILEAIRKKQIDKNKEKEGTLNVADAFYRVQGKF